MFLFKRKFCDMIGVYELSGLIYLRSYTRVMFTKGLTAQEPLDSSS